MLFATGRTGTIGRHFSPLVRGFSFTSYCNSGRISIPSSGGIFIHSAGIVGPSIVNEDPAFARSINVDKTLGLATDLLKTGALRKFVYVSSAHVYAKVSPSTRIREDARLAPQNLYAQQKLDAEEGLMDLFSARPDSLLILRLFSIFSSMGKPFTLGGRLNEIREGVRGVKIANGRDVRDFLTPIDAAAHIETIARSAANGIVNVCTGNPMTVRDAVSNWIAANSFDSRCEFLDENSSLPWLVGNPEKFLSITRVLPSFNARNA